MWLCRLKKADNSLLGQLQQLKTEFRVCCPLAAAIAQLKEHSFHDLPYPDPGSDAACAGFTVPAAGHMHVQNRFALLIGEDGSGACDLVDCLQNMLQGGDRPLITVFWAYDQSAA